MLFRTNPGSSTKWQLYDHLLAISPTIQIRRTRHVGHSWRSTDKLVSNVFFWTPTQGRASVVDTVYTLKDLPGAIDNKDE